MNFIVKNVNSNDECNMKKTEANMDKLDIKDAQIKEKDSVIINEVPEAKDETESRDVNLPKRDFKSEIIEIIRSDMSDDELRDAIQDYHDNDIASALEELTAEERSEFYRIIGEEEISDVFAYLDNVEDYIEELDAEEAADIIEEMDADDAIDLLEELEDDKREEIMQLLDDEAKEDIELINSYDDDVIGSRMSTNYVCFNKNLSIKHAMKSLVEQAADNDNITTLYAINDDETFYGAIELRDLVVAREGTPLNDIIATSYPRVYANETISDCIEQLKDYSEDSIPVVDNENKLIGVITATDIIEVVDEEMSEDYAKFAGLSEESDIDETVFKGMRKRLPWLVILLFLGLFVSSVIGVFENVIAGLTMIVCFQSMILGMAGNVGTQSLAVTIRVLMDENLSAKDKWKLIGREVRIGFCNGALLGIIAFTVVGCYITFIKHYDPGMAFLISGCIGVALLVAMTISSFMGTVIPMMFKAIKVDPAVASGPLISTINDLVAVVTYYGLAWIMLINIVGIG